MYISLLCIVAFFFCSFLHFLSLSFDFTFHCFDVKTC